MTHPDWREPARALRLRLGTATAEQRALAEHLGVPVGERTRYLVAAALLSDALASELDAPVREPSDEQLEYLAELDAWARRGDPEPTTRRLASAVSALRRTRRTLEALEAAKPSAGDIVVEYGYREPHDATVDPERYRIVSSIGADGMVYFLGGSGQRARIERVDVAYRAGDTSPSAAAAGKAAETRARDRRAAEDRGDTFSAVKFQQLLPWRVKPREVLGRDVDALRGVIETAKDEAPIQLFLQDRAHLLALLLAGAHHRWVVPQLRFGDRYVADFLMADSDSSGIRWQLVELESPRAKPLTKGGEWRKEARHAIHQIEQWRHYLRENVDTARKPRDREGLGLVDIEAGVPGLILVGRRSMVVDEPAWMRRSVAMASGVEIHTYDWLLERVERASRSSTGLR
jgi:hypothetical protein